MGKCLLLKGIFVFLCATVGFSCPLSVYHSVQIVDYILPWEDQSAEYPSNLARPLNVAIEASNGASDYGNKFGEPIIAGFARSFGLELPGFGDRREWIKPIMFTGGIGSISDSHVLKHSPTAGECFLACLYIVMT